MLLTFIVQSVPVWKHAGFSFPLGKEWFFRTALFGALPMIYGSIVVALIAVVIAGPIGLGAALFTSEYLPSNARRFVKTAIELLAGIPSVVYGLLGVLLLRDWVYHLLQSFDPLSGDTLLTAAILLAIMILPTIMTLADDAFRSVPHQQRAAARALGLNKAEATLFVSLPQARAGIVAAILLAFGRAIGETIAVFLVVGRQDNQLPSSVLSLRPLVEAGQTITSKLGGSETNIAYGDPLHWAAMVGLALLLLLGVSFLTWFGLRLGERPNA